MKHGLHLQTKEKTYVLFTASPEEAQVWVRVLALICEMNQNNVSIEQVNPYDYEKIKLATTEANSPRISEPPQN